MSINLICSSCQKQLSVPETALGKKIRCPKCHAVFVATDADVAEAIATQPMPRPAPPPLPSKATDNDQESPPKKKRRRVRDETEPFPPIQFRAVVKKKTDVFKKGIYHVRLDEEGLHIKLSNKETIDVPVGSPAEYENKNNIQIEIDGEWVEMAITRQRTYNNRFAAAVVDFLNRDLRGVYIEDFVISWTLFSLVALPLGAAIIGAAALALVQRNPGSQDFWGPIGLGFGISGATYAIISKEEWTPGLRVTLALLLNGLIYLGAFMLLVLVLVFRR